MWLFLLLGWPLAEIALFVVIGGKIGLWATLAWVLLSAVLGVALLRWALVRQAVALRDMRNPAQMLSGGAMGLAAGLLLILPGFLTDALGLLLLLPPVQALLARALAARLHVVRPGAPAGDVIDAEFTELGPRPQRPSGWVDGDRSLPPSP